MSWTRADAAVSGGLLLLGGLLTATALHAQEGPRGKATRARCANNLRQLGLAQIQYCDDKRAFPHVAPVAALDGGYRTNASTRKTRALVFFGYHDAPEGFVCPATPDLDEEVPEAARKELRRWSWGGQPAPEGNPLAAADAPDPALHETAELSYGWTRRAMTANTRGSALRTADRTEGNHGDGWHVGQVDGTVSFTALDDGAPLTAVEGAGASALAIRAQDEPAPKAPPRRGAAPLDGTWTDGDVTLRLRGGEGGYGGWLEVARKRYPARASGDPKALEGTFEANGAAFRLTAALEGEVLVLASGNATYRLRQRWRDAVPTGPVAAIQEGHEAVAIGALKLLVSAQTLFREGDKDDDGRLDYGTLEELARAEIIDEVLGSGTKFGYRFECRPSAKTPEFLWAATATPVDGMGAGRRAFIVNHAGVVHESKARAFSLALLGEAMGLPADATPVDLEAEARRREKARRMVGPPTPEVTAIESLMAINRAQTLFREGDREGDGLLDYGTLEELARAKLLDEALGAGAKNGYRFEVRPSPTSPEFLWCATATPIAGVAKERRAFCISQAGVLHYSTRRAFAIAELVKTCKPPRWAGPVGGAEPADEKR